MKMVFTTLTNERGGCVFILTNNNVAFVSGETIEVGRWKNDPSMDTYRIKNGDNYQYAVIADFGLHEVESLPEDFKPRKYCYTEEDGFYENPKWVERATEADYLAALARFGVTE